MKFRSGVIFVGLGLWAFSMSFGGINPGATVIPIELVDRASPQPPILEAPLHFSVVGDSGTPVGSLTADPGDGIILPEITEYPLKLRLTEEGWWAPDYSLDRASGDHESSPPWVLYRSSTLDFPATIYDSDQPLPPARVVCCGCADDQGSSTEPCGEAEATPFPDYYRVNLPRGCMDLSFITESYAPVELDHVEIPSGRRPNQRSILLLKGGSLAGTVVSADDGLPLAGVHVGASPLFPSAKQLSLAAKGQRQVTVQYGSDSSLVFSTKTNQRGRFRIAGLEPGLYKVHFERIGFAKLTMDRLEILKDSEVTVKAVEMGPGAFVEFLLSPADCFSEAFHVILSQERARQTAVVVRSAEASADGVIDFKILPAGKYTVDVQGKCGATEIRSLRSENFDLAFGERRFLPVEINLCPISGRILRDGRPVEATLSCRKWGQSASFEIVSNEGGYFNAAFPDPGDYEFKVHNEALDTTVSVEDLRCNSDHVVIELPTSRFSGVVRDESGQPVAGANVNAQQQINPEKKIHRAIHLSTSCDSQGSFAIEGPEPGTWVLTASESNLRSEGERLVLSEPDEVKEDLILVVRDQRIVHINTVDPVTGTKIPGLKLKVSWHLPEEGALDTKNMNLASDSRGEAQVELPQSVQSLRIVTSGSGRPLEWRRVKTAERIDCPSSREEGGRLVLMRDEGNWLRNGLPLVLIRHQGALMSPAEIDLQFGLGHPTTEGSGLELGPLASGRYGIIFIEKSEELAAFIAAPSAYPADEEVFLAGGSTRVVQAPF